jgi:hypothetical protein
MSPFLFLVYSEGKNKTQHSLHRNDNLPVNQVVEFENQNLVWSWGLSGKNCSGGSGGGCHLVFQNDGNLVLYYPDSSAIGTSTYGVNARYVYFTTRYASGMRRIF